ncbi:hypothetical protein ACE40V_24610 [Salmonella enterica]
MALAPDGHSAVVANGLSDTVSVVDLDSHAVKATIAVGGSPWGVAVAP